MADVPIAELELMQWLIELDNEEIKEKIERRWIKSRMIFEVLATDEKTTKKTLRKHIDGMKKLKNTLIIKKKFENVIKVKQSMRFEHAFSQIAEVELLSKDVETLLFTVIYFAPSSVEILEPKELKVGIHTIQSIMNSVADVMHKFSSGTGGIVIATKR